MKRSAGAPCSICLANAELVRRLFAVVPETRILCWTAVPSPLTAAEVLGLSRQTLYVKLRRHGLSGGDSDTAEAV